MQQRLLFWPSWLVTEEACNVINQPQLCRSHSKQKSTQEFETSIIQSMNQALTYQCYNAYILKKDRHFLCKEGVYSVCDLICRVDRVCCTFSV